MRCRQAGFTIIELMITIVIVAILAAVAGPSIRDLLLNARMTGLVNDFMGDLNVARGEAVKRGVRTAVCTSNNGTSCTGSAWNQGWIIFAETPDAGNAYGRVDGSDVILKIAPKIDGADDQMPTLITAENVLPASAGFYVGFRPSGVVMPGAAGPAIEFNMCDARRQGGSGDVTNKGRHVTLTGTGRAHFVRCTCNAAGTVCTP